MWLKWQAARYALLVLHIVLHTQKRVLSVRNESLRQDFRFQERIRIFNGMMLILFRSGKPLDSGRLEESVTGPSSEHKQIPLVTLWMISRSSFSTVLHPELGAKILHYFYMEQWRVGTIARQLGIHHATVERGTPSAGLPKAHLDRSLHPQRVRILNGQKQLRLR
jgi:hypothetical protein